MTTRGCWWMVLILLTTRMLSVLGSYNASLDEVLKARCFSFCLEEFGSLGTTTKEYDVYTPGYTCRNEDISCLQCSEGCEMQLNEHSEAGCQTDCNTKECQRSCQFLKEMKAYSFGDKVETSLKKSGGARVDIRDVRSQCQAKTGPNSVTSYIRWAADFSFNDSLPLSFIVELKNKDHNGKLVLVTSHGWLPIKHLNESTWYQLRITPVLKDGIAGEPVSSVWFKTISAIPSAINPPTEVSAKQFIVNFRVFVTISWKPSPEAACSYHVALLPHSTNGEPEIRNVRLLPDFRQTFGPLEYSTNYTVKIASCLSHPPCSENTSDLMFMSLSCLASSNYSYKLCPPETPEITDHYVTLRNNKESCIADVTIHWQPAKYLTTNNQIENYSIVWEKYILTGWTVPRRHVIHILPNYTNHTLNDLEANLSYNIFLAAFSEGGWSHPVQLPIKTSGICPHKANSSVSEKRKFRDGIILLTSIPLATAIVLLVLGTVFKVHRKGNFNRTKYFYFRKQKKNMDRMVRNPFYDRQQRSENQLSLTTFNETDSENSGSQTFQDDYEISYSWLTLGSILGSGAFGQVLKGSLSKAPNALRGNLALPMTVAVKMTKEFATEEERNNLRKEIELMKVLGRHQNIVSIIGFCGNQSNPGLIMDYCCHGDLRRYLRQTRSQNFNDSDSSSIDERCSSDSAVGRSLTSALTMSSISRRQHTGDNIPSEETIQREKPGIAMDLLLSFARQIAVAMEYLVHRKFVHRDLAARNILVCEGHVIKISDFGLTRDVYEDSAYAKKSGGKLPIKWMAPEAIFDQIYTTSSDVWSYGIVLWEIITLGGSPYPGINTHDIYQMLKRGYRMERPDYCDQQLYNIMRCCWRTNPLKRPSFSHLRSTIEDMMISCSESENSYMDFGDSQKHCDFEDFAKYYQNSENEPLKSHDYKESTLNNMEAESGSISYHSYECDDE